MTPLEDHQEGDMADQFIDRARLEAEAAEYAPDIDNNNLLAVHRAAKREAFMAGVDAANAQLLANAETEWGVRWTSEAGEVKVAGYNTEVGARTEFADFRVNDSDRVVSRRILRTAWTTDEEGK